MTMARVTIGDQIHEVEIDSRYSTLIPEEEKDNGNVIVAVKVNNEQLSLNHKVKGDCTVEFVHIRSSEGADIYRRSLCLILARAAQELHRNTRLVIGHSIGNGYYYDYITDVPVTETVLAQLEERMREIIAADERLVYKRYSREEAIELFRKEGYSDKVRLLEHIDLKEVAIHRCGSFIDIAYGPTVPSTGYLNVFKLRPYGPEGFVVNFPSRRDPKIAADLEEQRKLFTIHKESKHWGQILEVNNAGRLNELISRGEIGEYIKIAEALHERKISEIADQIWQQREKVRLILIAGPSSSGKTTFSKRLAIQLRVLGMIPYTLSMDNYFVDREHTPLDEDGNYDFESIECLDLELFNDHLTQLLRGREVNIPKFNFETGTRKPGFDLRLGHEQVLIVEGIHGLNEQLTHAVPAENKFKIYASALTQLCIDEANRIPTTDTRCIRRIVRDSQFRGYSAQETISRWPSVKRGEGRNIFPFQEEADAMFNSAIVYELSVLRPFVEPLLQEITQEHPEYTEAHRLHRFVRLFTPIPPDEVPNTSILREFIGGSSFHY